MISGDQAAKRCLGNVRRIFPRGRGLLLLIFYPLEMARTGNGSLSLPFILIVGSACIVCLLMGIVFEKMRGD